MLRGNEGFTFQKKIRESIGLMSYNDETDCAQGMWLCSKVWFSRSTFNELAIYINTGLESTHRRWVRQSVVQKQYTGSHICPVYTRATLLVLHKVPIYNKTLWSSG